jgi:RNA polymerase sigma factor (sigma-70 family)
MKSTILQMIVRLSRSLAAEGALQHADDNDLLTRFTSGRDQAAFATILERHGRLVWGVCRGLLPNDVDAEDAFQATFIALFRGATKVRHTQSLAPWLHGAATRIAKKIRLAAARRRGREHRSAKSEIAPPFLSDENWEALNLAVHDEIARLPAVLRMAFVLCVLEGRRHLDAAALLGVPVGTVSARVSRARKKLMEQLSARGLTPVVAASAVVCAAGPLTAGVPPPLLLLVQRHLGDGFASVSNSILQLANTIAGGTSMTGKWLSAVLIAGTLLAAVSGAWYTSARQNVNAAPGTNPVAAIDQPTPALQAEKPRADRVDNHGDPLPAGALARLGTVRLRHGGAIHVAAFSPDGLLLATGGADKVVRLWEAATGKPIATLRGHTQDITSLVFSPDGKTLLSGSGDFISRFRGDTKLWDVATRRERLTLSGRSDADTAAFAPDGRVVATASFGGVRLWDAATGKEIRNWEAHPGVFPAGSGGGLPRGYWIYSMAYSPDGNTLVTASDDKSVRFWDPQTGQELRRLPGDFGEVYAVAFSSDGKLLATSSSDKTVRLWDPATGKLVREVATHKKQAARSLAFFDSDKQLVVGSYDSGIEAWDVATGKKVRQLSAHPDFAACLAFSPDGQRLAAAGWGDYAAVLCDVRTGQQVGPVGQATSRVYALVFAADGRVLTSGGRTGPLRVWDPTTGKEAAPWEGKSRDICSMTLAPDGKTLATGLDKGVIQLWDAARGRELRQVKIPNWGWGYVRGLAFSPDGRKLAASGNDGKVRLLDVATDTVTRELATDPRGFITVVAFSPDGATLAVSLGDSDGSGDMWGDIGLWDVATGKLRLRLRGHYNAICSLTFSPSGKLLASVTEPHSASTERAMLLWDVKTGKQLVHLELGQTAGVHCAGALAVEFSPDGKTLATAGTDETVSLWEVATGALRRRFHGHTAAIGKLAFFPDGRILASASSDTTVLLWDVAGLTAAERRELRDPKAGQPLQLWEDLAAADPTRAYLAMRLLIASPNDALPLLRERLQPIAKPDVGRIKRLVADLDSKQFKVREQAEKELAQIGDLAETLLLQALDNRPSLEVRQRVEALLSKCAETAVPAPERVRVLRALEVLEGIANADSCRILETVAAGAAESRITREAAAAVRRLRRGLGKTHDKP